MSCFGTFLRWINFDEKKVRFRISLAHERVTTTARRVDENFLTPFDYNS